MKKTIALLLVLSLAFCCMACGKNNDDVTTTENYEEIPSTDYESSSDYSLTTLPVPSETVPTTEATTVPSTVPSTEPPTAPAPSTEAPTSQAPSTNPQPDTSPAGILNVLATAVNKTKGYKSAITVNHKEAFDIVEPVVKLEKGGAAFSNLATRAVNFVKDLVLKPSEEVYNFSNGKATTSEGESTQLLLPKDKPFGIGAEAVASATMTTENGMAHIKITLKPEETHSLSEVPQNHSNSIGYLNLDGKFSIIQIKELDIKYPGSTIDAYIRSDGYVQSVTYVINLEAYAKASGMGVTGSATFSGSQTEIWNINW